MSRKHALEPVGGEVDLLLSLEPGRSRGCGIPLQYVSVDRRVCEQQVCRAWRHVAEGGGDARLAGGPVVESGDQDVGAAMVVDGALVDQQAAAGVSVGSCELAAVDLRPVLPVAEDGVFRQLG